MRYKCNACKAVLEIAARTPFLMLRRRRTPPETCPRCGSNETALLSTRDEFLDFIKSAPKLLLGVLTFLIGLFLLEIAAIVLCPLLGHGQHWLEALILLIVVFIFVLTSLTFAAKNIKTLGSRTALILDGLLIIALYVYTALRAAASETRLMNP